MKTLHLIVNERCRHSIHVDNDRFGRGQEKIIHLLEQEAEGEAAEIIVCDSDNMPISYLPIESTRKRDCLNHRLTEAVLIISSVVIFLLFF